MHSLCQTILQVDLMTRKDTSYFLCRYYFGFFAIYCASGMVAGARLFENLFGMSYTTAIWLSAIATISYVCIGGFLAISWTDTFQAGLMIFALLLTQS